jgi:hypothetical protein
VSPATYFLPILLQSPLLSAMREKLNKLSNSTRVRRNGCRMHMLLPGTRKYCFAATPVIKKKINEVVKSKQALQNWNTLQNWNIFMHRYAIKNYGFTIMLWYCRLVTAPLYFRQTPQTAFPVCGSKTFLQTTVPYCDNGNIPVPGCLDLYPVHALAFVASHTCTA